MSEDPNSGCSVALKCAVEDVEAWDEILSPDWSHPYLWARLIPRVVQDQWVGMTDGERMAAYLVAEKLAENSDAGDE